ncbi:hypothetical protein [Microcoleus sp.]|uniref:hypothetical protein n=1 Tax=Microcoleus sp. TaxID=44472 RepID=UPI003525A62E
MVLQSKTFSVQLLPAYVVDSVVEVIHFRGLTVQSDELVAIYLDQATGCVDLNSMNIGKVPDLTGDETDIEKSLALTKAESNSNKLGLKFLTRKNNTGNWTEIAEFILLNYGRKDYPDFRGRLGYPSRLLELNDAIGVQLVDYGDGLLWDKDLIGLSFGCTIDVSKKNDLTELSARIASLELALEGKLINLPSNTLLGRNSANNGTVEVISQTQFVEQVDLATVFAQHTNGDEHGNYLTNARADVRYVALTGTQTIGGAKTFSNGSTKFGAGGEVLSTASSQIGFYSGYSWNGNALLSNNPSSGFVGINFYQPGIAFCYDSGLATGTNGIAIATKLLVGSSNVQIPISVPSTSPTTGALVITGGLGVGGNLNTGGFTSLGDSNTGIKCKVINFTSPTTTANTLVANGLLPAMDKIVAITGMIQASSTDWFQPNHYGGTTYANTKLWSLYQWSNNAYISLHPDAVVSMGNRPGKLIVTYTN